MTKSAPWPFSAPLTVDDLARMPDDGRRYELLNGELLVSPAPSHAHQRIVISLVVLLHDVLPATHEVLVAQFDWRVSRSTSFQPDLIVARRDEVGPLRLERAPLVAVEVLSPSTRRIDLGEKRRAYAAFGVEHYWIVDPDGPTVSFLRHNGSDYDEIAVARGNTTVEVTEPFPVAITPDDLLR